MKKNLLIICLFLFTSALFAQPYGNEWINYNQKYFFFKITQDNIYRINVSTLASTLTNAGVSLSSLDHRNFQLFGRGRQIPLFIKDDGVQFILDGDDYIEFYAQKNDGYFDALMYKNIADQPNPYYSLINDTAIYYFTWNNSVNNERMNYQDASNFVDFTASAFVIKENIQSYTSEYFRGEPVSDQDADPDYTKAEGWFNAVMNQGNVVIKSFPTPNVFTSGPAAEFKTVVIGASKQSNTTLDHHTRIEFKNSAGIYVNLTERHYLGYEKNNIVNAVSTSALHSVATDFKFTAVAGNRTTFSWASLRYPHTMNLFGNLSFEMIVPDNLNQSKSLLEFQNFNINNTLFDVFLYDVTNSRKIKAYLNGGIYRMLVPNSGAGKSESKCYLLPENQIPFITNLESVNPVSHQFQNFTNSNANYLIITHQKLKAEAQDYANYRAGTGHSTLVVDVNELYHQFGNGINKHPLSIKHFADFSLNNWSVKPEHLFLIGKSIKAEFTRNSPSGYASCLVPSYGTAPSDALLTAGLNGTTFDPAIATGRLAAKNSNDVKIYHKKMVEYESYVSPEEWMKTVLHFRGGSTANEHNTFTQYLNSYEQIIEDTLFGGNVTTFTKNSSSPIDNTLAGIIRDNMEDGVSLMTFFGHGSTTGFDINIDDPATYNNHKKYPVLLANSCFAGNIHEPSSISASESFVLIADKGVIAFVANVSLGFPHMLHSFSNRFYRNIGSTHYGESIGVVMRETIKAIKDTSNNMNKALCLQMTLHGDPALVINSFEKPDIVLTQPNVFFTPGNVTTEVDSFDVNVVLTNLGHAFNKVFSLELARKFPDGSVKKEIAIRSGLNFKDTVIFRLPVDFDKGPGENVFSVFADNSLLIDELSEINNKITKRLTISSSDILPIYPYHYAIVPNQNVTLKASTSNPFAPSRKYVLEVDTTDLFNSPIKEKTEITQSGGVVQWSPNLLKNMPDSMVYFWRASPLIEAPLAMRWRESSFQYIKDKSGWGQSHFFQFKNNDFNFVGYNRVQRKFMFQNFVRQLSCTNIGNASIIETFKITFKIDADMQDEASCGGSPAIHIAVIDPLILEAWTTAQKPQFDLQSCRVSKYFVFYPSVAGNLDVMTDMIKDSVPNGHYILAYSMFNPMCTQWGANTHSAFQNLGADPALLTNTDSLPFIFFVHKGQPFTAITVIGDNPRAEISLMTNISRDQPFGDFNSVIAGPAKEWHSFHWRQQSVENPSNDDVSVDITGIDLTGNETHLMNINQATTDISNLNIDANSFPYLKLTAHLRDDVTQTPAQMKRWQLLFDEIPEAALNASKNFYFYADTIDEGDKINFRVAIQNISNTDMDSINVKYWIEDISRNIIPLEYKTLAPLYKDSVLITSIELSTLGYPGQNSLWVEINPKDANWQLEQYHFNNKAQLGFFVGRDNINPMLDVTFDGVHIINGDIVSAKPYIVAQLKDENKFLALNDTSSFAVYLKNPLGSLKRIYFQSEGEEQMRFIPAVLPKNSCRIEFQPHLIEDGEYELRVMANDISKNQSGSFDYVISFEVINKSTITEVLNFPNPFSTSTRFVFTLTGSVIPSHFKIQIMTITGKVVREIHKDELGPIRIGRNITDFAWDGRDEFGDMLANGVYLYRVITRIDGAAIEHSATNADKFFHKGFGKMYLMR
ncbi:MAG: C25 family cysteine peptidase [Bacteroidota bacterium]|nr:C25 family cysteine peptidase [Bacteroidota bacterium]